MMNDEKLTKSVLPHAELYDLLHLDCMATKRQKKKEYEKKQDNKWNTKEI